jgi:hypothetical protein
MLVYVNSRSTKLPRNKVYKKKFKEMELKDNRVISPYKSLDINECRKT